MTEQQYEVALRKAWGQSLATHRNAKGLGAQTLADSTGLSLDTIWRIEKGDRFPSERVKRLLAAVLQVPIAQLFPYSPIAPDFPDGAWRKEVPA